MLFRSTVTTDVNIMTADEYINGRLRTASNFVVVANTAGAAAMVTVMAAAAFVNGAVTLFQDDFNTANPPATREDTTDSANVYDLLQETTTRSGNRYADAYLQPELDTLDAQDTADVTAQTHVDDTANATILAVTDTSGARGTGAMETDVFWIVYLSTAFEARPAADFDPHTTEGVTRGVATGGNEVCLVFVEACRDFVADATAAQNPNAVTREAQRARTAVHEIGHQFDVANVAGEHRNDDMNVMDSSSSDPTDANFFFDSRDIAFLRLRHQSP